MKYRELIEGQQHATGGQRPAGADKGENQMKCPKCFEEIPSSMLASELGKMGKGKKKDYTNKEREKRRERMVKVREAKKLKK